MPSEPKPSVTERISYSVQEVADQHGLCVKTVRRMVASGELRAIRFNTALRIPKSEIERKLKGG